MVCFLALYLNKYNHKNLEIWDHSRFPHFFFFTLFLLKQKLTLKRRGAFPIICQQGLGLLTTRIYQRMYMYERKRRIRKQNEFPWRAFLHRIKTFLLNLNFPMKSLKKKYNINLVVHSTWGCLLLCRSIAIIIVI